MNSIDVFDGEYDFLSNFYDAEVTYEGRLYKSSEHAYQAAKAKIDTVIKIGDEEVNAREWVAESSAPAVSKKRGRKVKMRLDWDSVKVGVMEEIVRNKFSSNEELKDKLLATGDKELVEGNWWNDTFWGMCRGKGKNNLGKILMKIRDEIRKRKDKPLIISVTGHRPKYFGTYDEDSESILLVKKSIREFLESRNVKELISGMAMGVDIWSAEIAIELDIPVVAAIPFKGQDKTWAPSIKERYVSILKSADRIYELSESLESFTYKQFLEIPYQKRNFDRVRYCLLQRNMWMVDHADEVMAVWSGNRGGTGHCVRYAKGNRVSGGFVTPKIKKVHNLWQDDMRNE